jgi:hypothetical protein
MHHCGNHEADSQGRKHARSRNASPPLPKAVAQYGRAEWCALLHLARMAEPGNSSQTAISRQIARN